MKRAALCSLALAGASALAAPAAPATGGTLPAAPPTKAEIALGEQLALHGAQGVPACFSCHGQHGEGNGAAGYPRLAGQPETYLLHQLLAIGHGARRNAVMAPIARAMNERQMRAASAYYAAINPSAEAPSATGGASSPSARPATPAPEPPVSAAAAALAHRLASVGDEARRVQACANCHGPGGTGSPPTVPYLAGQNRAYLVAQMAAWKDGSRHTDPSGQMPRIAQALSRADVDALAALYSELPPPPAREQRREAVLAQAGGATATRIVSGPRAPAGAASIPKGHAGVGTEQGAPLVGGAQTPGGSQDHPQVKPAQGSQAQKPQR